jgi:hypothetical protein
MIYFCAKFPLQTAFNKRKYSSEPTWQEAGRAPASFCAWMRRRKFRETKPAYPSPIWQFNEWSISAHKILNAKYDCVVCKSVNLYIIMKVYFVLGLPHVPVWPGLSRFEGLVPRSRPVCHFFPVRKKNKNIKNGTKWNKKAEEIKKIEVSIVELATQLTAGLITSLRITTHRV